MIFTKAIFTFKKTKMQISYKHICKITILVLVSLLVEYLIGFIEGLPRNICFKYIITFSET